MTVAPLPPPHWLCYPPHSTHLLQALDFGCFSVLKHSYGQLVQEKAELGVFHIDKPDFLVLYYQTHQITFTEKTIKNAFEATGIVPFNAQKVLSWLMVKTPSSQLQPQTLEPQSQLPLVTPPNITELDAQVKAFQQHCMRVADNHSSPTDQALHYFLGRK